MNDNIINRIKLITSVHRQEFERANHLSTDRPRISFAESHLRKIAEEVQELTRESEWNDERGMIKESCDIIIIALAFLAEISQNPDQELDERLGIIERKVGIK